MKSMLQSLRIISLMLSLGGASLGHAAFADPDAMAEHCQSMPDMPGCERYRPTHSTAPPAASNTSPKWVLPGEGQGALPPAVATPVVELKDGDHYLLRAGLVTKTIAGTLLRLYAYNGSVPGPLLKVQQGSTVTIEFENAIDQDTTVHWHGLRVDARQDGTPGISQAPVPPGGKHRYTLRFPDDGMYWYHPHVREDFQQDAGLYGNLWVLPRDPKAYAPVDREVALIVDDILIENGQQTPYGKEAATYALMGRFGNVLLVNGEDHYQLSVRAGETVRFYLTNAANARTFNLSLPGVRLKRVGGDSGRYEHETEVDSVVLAPSERVIVEATFAQPGHVVLTHTTPDRSYALGQITVAAGEHKKISGSLRDSPEVQAEVAAFAPYRQAPPDYTLTVGLDMPGMGGAGSEHGGHGGHGQLTAAPPPIEWEDDMGAMNAAATSAALRWVLRDQATGAENMAIHYRFERGKPVKIRLINPVTGMHPMQHPIHFHGQRFLVLAINGQPVENQVWKDTVLVPTGATVDIVLDPSNPGDWMAHCHIAEHLTAGMMFGFQVVEPGGR